MFCYEKQQDYINLKINNAIFKTICYNQHRTLQTE